MPHGQEQVIRERKVKLSAVMVYSSYSPYQVERKEGGNRQLQWFLPEIHLIGGSGGWSFHSAVRPAVKREELHLKGKLVFLPSSPSVLLSPPLPQIGQGLHKSVVTGDIVSVGQSPVKIKANLWMTLCNN